MLDAGRSPFSFYNGLSLRKHIKTSPPTMIIWIVEKMQSHSHFIDPTGKMNPLGDITKEVMVEAFHIKGVRTLQKIKIFPRSDTTPEVNASLK